MNIKKIEKKLSQLLPVEFRSTKGIPSLKHCIGVERILGTYMPDILIESLGVRNPKHIEPLIYLVTLLRSYIVLDDFIRDTPSIDSSVRNIITIGVDNIEKECKILITTLGSDSSIFDDYLKTVEYTYLNFEKIETKEAIINKCLLIFLVFKLPIYTNKHEVAHLEDGLKRLLFSLQLMDDIVDIEEDQVSNINHNIYTSGLSSTEIDKVISSRFFILIHSIKTYESTLNVLLESKSKTLAAQIKKSLAYIKEKKGRYGLENKNAISPSIEQWSPNFTLSIRDKFISEIGRTKSFCISDFSAESVHSGGAINVNSS